MPNRLIAVRDSVRLPVESNAALRMSRLGTLDRRLLTDEGGSAILSAVPAVRHVTPSVAPGCIHVQRFQSITSRRSTRVVVAATTSGFCSRSMLIHPLKGG